MGDPLPDGSGGGLRPDLRLPASDFNLGNPADPADHPAGHGPGASVCKASAATDRERPQGFLRRTNRHSRVEIQG